MEKRNLQNNNELIFNLCWIQNLNDHEIHKIKNYLKFLLRIKASVYYYSYYSFQWDNFTKTMFCFAGIL